ncbi:hypothetical protein [Brevundimonas sp. SL130]|uniref:hypothetical protein n=1 Tax=Brevundimonas sp. SL130 TaxID=2995143 RepID=UPI00226D132E|nr:hypothetical protein [Brevundimonas sp. SL130]WAC60689.1 hypothetical protein OU998_04365 [Brevundimonas sp. SL130]
MTLTELHATLDRLGPDLSVWPSTLAEPALDLISVSDAAKDLFAAATEASLRVDATPAPRWETTSATAP